MDRKKSERRTGRHRATDLLAHGHVKNLSPEVATDGLVDPKGPRSTAHVAGIFPDWSYAALEKMDRVAQLQTRKGKVVQELHEGLHRVDILQHDSQSVSVGVGGRGILFMKEAPSVGELWGPYAAKNILKSGASFGGLGGWRRGGGVGLVDAGQVVDLQSWVVLVGCHGDGDGGGVSENDGDNCRQEGPTSSTLFSVSEYHLKCHSEVE